ncbi:MAG: VOC family protein [Candidatus Dormibacteria bacterium]
MTWATSIAAVTLFAEDLEATRDFYARAFGQKTVFEDANSAVFKVGGTLINLLRISEAPGLVAPARVGARDAGARMQFTVGVDDVDAMCAELAGRGIEILNGPMDRPWGVRTASFQDPAGHIWEIAR